MAGYDYPSPNAPQPLESGNQPTGSGAEDFLKLDETERPKRPWVGCMVFLLVLAGVIFALWFFLFRIDEEEPIEGEETSQGEETPELSYSKLIGVSGGRVEYFDGAYVEIPAGALSEEKRIAIERVSSGRVTDLYHLTPDGLSFLKNVTVGVPYHEDSLSEFETPWDINLFTGETSTRLPKQHDTSANTGKKIVTAEISSF